jgi:hypothetical protein
MHQPCSKLETLKNIGFKLCQIINLPGAPKYLGPAMNFDASVSLHIYIQVTTLCCFGPQTFQFKNRPCANLCRLLSTPYTLAFPLITKECLLHYTHPAIWITPGHHSARFIQFKSISYVQLRTTNK